MSIDLEYDRRSTHLAYENAVRCTTLYFTRLGGKQADALEQGRRIVEIAVDRFAALAPEEMTASLDRMAVSLAMEERRLLTKQAFAVTPPEARRSMRPSAPNRLAGPLRWASYGALLGSLRAVVARWRPSALIPREI